MELTEEMYKKKWISKRIEKLHICYDYFLNILK